MNERTDTRWIGIQSDRLDAAAVSDFLRAEEAGAVQLFLGTTRRWTDGKETTSLDYECYAPMALEEMKRLVMEAAARWPIAKACILHRHGEVPLREASVIIGVSTPHRADAFAACRYLIDTLKERVPIWKKEQYADGTTEWVDPTQRSER